MYEGFVQDQWRAHSRLVIKAAIRYSIMNPYYAIWGNLTSSTKAATLQDLSSLGTFTLAYAGRRGIYLEELLNIN